MGEISILRNIYIAATLGYSQNYSEAGAVYSFLHQIDSAKPTFVDYPDRAYHFKSREEAIEAISKIEKNHKGLYARWQILEFFEKDPTAR